MRTINIVAIIFSIIGIIFLCLAIMVFTDNSSNEALLISGIFGFIALSFCGFGFTYLIITIRKWKLKKWLLKNGIEIKVKIDEIKSTNIKVNRRSTYRIICNIVDPVWNRNITVKSRLLIKPQLKLLEKQNINEVSILVDPNDYQRNCMVDDFLF